jgi:hypothetical protein
MRAVVSWASLRKTFGRPSNSLFGIEVIGVGRLVPLLLAHSFQVSIVDLHHATGLVPRREEPRKQVEEHRRKVLLLFLRRGAQDVIAPPEKQYTTQEPATLGCVRRRIRRGAIHRILGGIYRRTPRRFQPRRGLTGGTCRRARAWRAVFAERASGDSCPHPLLMPETEVTAEKG